MYARVHIVFYKRIDMMKVEASSSCISSLYANKCITLFYRLKMG